jgi:hypothetical protein
MEYPPAVQGEAPFSMSMDTLDEDSGDILRSSPSASRTILGGRTFHLQNPMDAYSSGSPRDSAYFLR